MNKRSLLHLVAATACAAALPASAGATTPAQPVAPQWFVDQGGAPDRGTTAAPARIKLRSACRRSRRCSSAPRHLRPTPKAASFHNHARQPAFQRCFDKSSFWGYGQSSSKITMSSPFLSGGPTGSEMVLMRAHIYRWDNGAFRQTATSALWGAIVVAGNFTRWMNLDTRVTYNDPTEQVNLTASAARGYYKVQWAMFFYTPRGAFKESLWHEGVHTNFDPQVSGTTIGWCGFAA